MGQICGKFITYEPGLRAPLDANVLHKWNINIIIKDQNIVTPSLAKQNAIITFFIIMVIIYLYKKLNY